MTRPALSCPSCKSDQVEILSSGLWDGMDKEGRGIGGMFEYGTCKECGCRCAQYVDGHIYVPAEEEWRSHFEPMEQRCRRVQSWPFDPDENTVA